MLHKSRKNDCKINRRNNSDNVKYHIGNEKIDDNAGRK